jgi:hypothetical protein
MKKCLHSWGQRLVLILLVLCTLHLSSFSQLSAGNYFEGGFTAGPMGFLGDLGGNYGKGKGFVKDYNLPTTQIAVGIHLTAHPAEWLGIRFAFNYGNINGDDARTTGKNGEEQTRKNRNLDFRSQITEGFIAAELYPTVFLEDDPTEVQGRLRPYGILGVGVFHFNPQGTYTDPSTGVKSWVYLRPLHTEGQGFAEYPDRKMYSLTQINIPMGVGIKYYFSERLNVSFEIVHRKTFTDYIDDVSTKFVDPTLFYKYLPPAQAAVADQMSNKSPLRGIPNMGYNPGDKRGDPTQKDAYFTAGFKIGIRLGATTESQWRNRTRCPIMRF